MAPGPYRPRIALAFTVAEIDAQTEGLSPAEKWAYVLIADQMWQGGGIVPDSDAFLVEAGGLKDHRGRRREIRRLRKCFRKLPLPAAWSEREALIPQVAAWAGIDEQMVERMGLLRFENALTIPGMIARLARRASQSDKTNDAVKVALGPRPTSADIDAMAEAFRVVAREFGLPIPLLKLSESRRRSLRARFADCRRQAMNGQDPIEVWQVAMTALRGDRFLTGRKRDHDGDSFRATIDTICRPATFNRLLEVGIDGTSADTSPDYDPDATRGRHAGLRRAAELD